LTRYDKFSLLADWILPTDLNWLDEWIHPADPIRLDELISLPELTKPRAAADTTLDAVENTKQRFGRSPAVCLGLPPSTFLALLCVCVLLFSAALVAKWRPNDWWLHTAVSINDLANNPRRSATGRITWCFP
jgi:hypothetical protein